MKWWPEFKGVYMKNVGLRVMVGVFILLMMGLQQALACNALFIVKDVTFTGEAGDQSVYNILDGLGINVTVKTATSTNNFTSSDLTGKHIIIVSASIASADVNTRLNSTTVPVLNLEPNLMDDLNMTGAATGGVDYGSSVGSSVISILSGSTGHQMAAGLSGNITVYSSSANLVYGATLGSGAQSIATVSGDATKKVIFGYDAGAVMVPSSVTAQGRRVGFFTDENTANLLTTNGTNLFKAATFWAMSVTVPSAPAPTTSSVAAGGTATVSVSASGGFLSYQWQKLSGSTWSNVSGANYSGGTSATLSIANTTAADNGTQYRVIVTNMAGTATTAGVSLSILFAPVISPAMSNVTVTVGQSGTFTVTATGNPTPNYVWKKGATTVGTNSPSYTTSATTSANDGDAYSVTVSNSQGTTTGSASLIVIYPPTFSDNQPVDKDVITGGSTSFSVSAAGNALNYLWEKKVGTGSWTTVSGATTSSYSPSTAIADNGTKYRVTVSNSQGSKMSREALLNVQYAPSISAGGQPASINVVAGTQATFSVTATGNPTPTYQWRKGGVNIPGATGISYTTPATTSADNQAVYSVVLTNSVQQVISSVATLTVSTQPNSNPPAFAFNFDEGIGTTEANAGTLAGYTDPFTSVFTWSNHAPINGTNSLNLGNTSGDYGVDFTGTDRLEDLTSFTITGWINATSITTGPGGNRIVTWLPGGSSKGVDLAFQSDGRLALGINQWNDAASGVNPSNVSGSVASTSKITVDPAGSFNNWRFFAVTYDGTVATNNVKFYFGTNSSTATLDQVWTYTPPTRTPDISPVLTLGNHVPLIRAAGNTTQLFKGYLDQIHIYTSTTDGGGAKTAPELAVIQNAAPIMGRAGIRYEEFDAIGGAGQLKDLMAAPNFPDNPSATKVLQSFSFPVSTNTYFGVKMSGWIKAPETGDYVFWISANDQAELRLSTDANPMNKMIIASVPSFAEQGNWTKFPVQKSLNIHLDAGKMYYIETLLAQSLGTARLEVKWVIPSSTQGQPGTEEDPIPGGRLFLTPNEGDAIFPSAISLYEKGSSEKKVTMGWGGEHFTVNTEGEDKLKITNDIVSVPKKFYLGYGNGIPDDLGFRYTPPGNGAGTPSLDFGTADNRPAFTINGEIDQPDPNSTPFVNFNKNFTMTGPDWNDNDNFVWNAKASLDYRDGFYSKQAHLGNSTNHTSETKTVSLNTESVDLEDNTTVATNVGSIVNNEKTSLTSRKFSATATSTTSGVHSATWNVEVDPINGITYTSTEDGQKTMTTIGTEGVATSELVLTPKWKVSKLVIPDYVFDKGYHLQSLEETEKYIKAHKHLPEVPAAKEIKEKGINVTEMNLKLLKKVEELTLHMIAVDKELKAQKKENQHLKEVMSSIQNPGKGE